MIDSNTLMMVILTILFVVMPIAKKLINALKTRRERGQLCQIHEGTGYRRLKKINFRTKGPNVLVPYRGGSKRGDIELPAVVISFDGDLHAKGHELFAQLADEVIENRPFIHEVVVRVTSPGGSVPPYGLLYAHMERIRESGVALTACVDTFGASGGYLTVAPATKIVASPLAMIGSIGVVSHLLNYHRFLQKLGIDSITVTAGDRKRSITATDPVTDEAKEFTKAKLAEFHRIFIAAVRKYRPQVDVRLCDGDAWSAQETVEKNFGLVDELKTSAQYLSELNKERDLVFLSAKSTTWATPFFNFTTRIAAGLADRVIAKLTGAGFEI